MVKRILSFGLCALLSACSSSETPVGKEDHMFLRSYVPVYSSGEFAADPHFAGLALFRNITLGKESHYSPDYGSSGGEVNDFMQYATRNNDLSYDQWENWLSYHWRICCAENFREVHVVCTDTDLDASHPAGTLLDDVAFLKVRTYAPFIRRGYQGSGYEDIRKRVSEFTEEDLAVLDVHMELEFDLPARQRTYTVQVTFVTTEGAEKSVVGQFQW